MSRNGELFFFDKEEVDGKCIASYEENEERFAEAEKNEKQNIFGELHR